ncbi:MAG: SGNH/GDSL hydrolase family protein, partial [Pseudolabrys sp.]
MMKRDFHAFIAPSALVCCSLLAGYILVEVGYRAFTYASFYEQMRFAAGRAFIAGKNSIFDEHTGYRYEPNLVDPNFRTNSHGLIAREEFPVEKPADEYRIGVIGASFTANVDSTIRWTDVVEDALNASTAWRVSVGGRRTRVINFGLDGIGFSQYGAVAERIALPFDLDLLFVNVTTNDFVRRPYYRGPLSAMSEAQLSAHIT